jgi:anti-anti-sigma factor
MSTAPAIFSPVGRIDGTNAGAAEVELKAVLESAGPNLIMDLSGVDYLSSAGLRVVLVAAKSTRASGGKLVLAGPRPAISEILAMSGFNRIIETAPDVEAATALFGKP